MILLLLLWPVFIRDFSPVRVRLFQSRLHLFYVILLLFLKAQDPIPSDGQVKKVQLEIKDDDLPEPDEQVLVYLTDAMGGARVATDSDSGLQVSHTYR